MLVRLRSAPKSYAPLTIHTWLTGGGKSAFASKGDKLAEGIAKTIDQRPTERWLVVCHRRDGRVGDVERAVIKQLSTIARPNVQFITGEITRQRMSSSMSPM